MTDTNLAAVLHGKCDLRMDEIPIPEPGPREVQVSVNCTGICGTDIHLYKYGDVGRFKWTCPYVLGHESSGTVSKLGQGVTHLQVGDRVAVDPGLPCRKCDVCWKGRGNLCPNMIVMGAPPVNGGLARYVVTIASNCFKLPDHVTFIEGAMLQPLSVVVHAFTRCPLTVGDTVLVCGAGPIGLMCLLVAKAMGASSVALTDICPSRLALAKTLGADHTVLACADDPKDVAHQVTTALGTPADVTFECTGVDASVQAAVYATQMGGILGLVGIGHEQTTMPLQDAIMREVNIVPCIKYDNAYPTALGLVASGQVNIKPLVTHHFPLTNCLDAFNTVMTTDSGAMKVIVDCFKP